MTTQRDEGLAMARFAYYGITTAEDEMEAERMNKELKPCPFCGNTGRCNSHPYAPNRYRAWVECDSCAASGPPVSSDISEAEAQLLAATLWNRRQESKNTPAGASEG